ncbi:hypothetical protein DOTSEDRAFT_176170 [Dothistroma septosporum NZE10]|uniref:Arrestin-like N-terminal domain-containing protein n=1 Tax=Dothistroma septosporum (strain NZE10 / CBS 128990) TaxID=675120 RepID=N1PEX5_DOTSN|nr:hypothetical protein DOTSEDRAFT_176170 [Dothistroma septosporum NZE10]
MAPWSSSPQVDVHIKFDVEDRSELTLHAPTYVGDEYITGTATFSSVKKHESSRYKIAVKGIVQTKTTELPAGGLQSTLSIETHTFLCATLFEGLVPASLHDDKRYMAQVPFKFSLANSHDCSSDSSRSLDHASRQYLPSIDSKTAGRHWSNTFKTGPDAKYSVTYTIIATVMSDRRRVFSASRPFSYLPSTHDPVRLALEDFPEEYVVRTTKAIKSSSTSLSRIGIISQEPHALLLHRNVNGGETDVNLCLMLLRDGTTSFGKDSLPRQARIRAELRTTTIVATRAGTPAAHTLPGALKSRAVIKQEKSNAQEYRVTLNQWHCPDSESEEDQRMTTTSEEVLTNSLAMSFRIAGSPYLPPAFHSPLLSRRYAIDLALTFDDDNSTVVSLRLPVLIGYKT